jgi:hypothetical protein
MGRGDTPGDEWFDGEGSIPAARRTFQTVEAPIR